jgi:hypothetical protein
MECQSTGMPREASLDPHRPGAIRRNLRPAVLSLALMTAICLAISRVLVASNLGEREHGESYWLNI